MRGGEVRTVSLPKSGRSMNNRAVVKNKTARRPPILKTLVLTPVLELSAHRRR